MRRPDKRRDPAREDLQSDEEEFLVARLRNNVRVFAANNGHTLSFVRGHIAELNRLELDKTTGQFMPRECFPKLVGELLQASPDSLGREVDPTAAIPDYPQGVICYIDNFGNIKTTYRDHDDIIRHVKSLGSGARIRIEINGEVRAAALNTGTVDLLEGDMMFGPEPGAYLNRAWEISCRKSDAAGIFNNPPPGSAIKLIIHQR